jgi:hypothetical protein
MEINNSSVPQTAREVDNTVSNSFDSNTEGLIERLRTRAQIRRQIPTRKSVQEGKPDRISDLLEEAANAIESLRR